MSAGCSKQTLGIPNPEAYGWLKHQKVDRFFRVHKNLFASLIHLLDSSILVVLIHIQKNHKISQLKSFNHQSYNMLTIDCLSNRIDIYPSPRDHTKPVIRLRRWRGRRRCCRGGRLWWSRGWPMGLRLLCNGWSLGENGKWKEVTQEDLH